MLTNPQTSQNRILVIDDEAKLLLGMTAIMRRSGFEVYSAGSGSEGLRLAASVRPDLILCDVMMPPPNGFEVKKTLAMDPLTAGIPFIFLTARTFQADKIAGLNLGADDYITKPFDVDELIARVNSLFRRIEIDREKARQETEAALEKVRRSVSSNLCHEMRTPLGIIQSCLDLAIRSKFDGNAEEMDWYLNSILASSQRLSTLVNDLTLLYDLDQNHINRFRSPINLKFHFFEPVKKTMTLWEAKQLRYDFQVNARVSLYAPEREFIQAVTHLIDNAAKFSPDEGQIIVRLEPNGVGGCILQVIDEGPGIPFPLREKVFERYYQIDHGDNRSYGGLGVGLTIARAIAERLGGSVTIEDSEKGCHVKMVIPPVPNYMLEDLRKLTPLGDC